MRVILLALTLLLTATLSSKAKANTVRVEIVEEQERRDTKMFCSKTNEQAAKRECEQWLDAQRKTLGDRLLTAYCSASEISSEPTSACLYRSVGELKYVLRSYRTETPLSR
jgi:hypothetical protein